MKSVFQNRAIEVLLLTTSLIFARSFPAAAQKEFDTVPEEMSYCFEGNWPCTEEPIPTSPTFPSQSDSLGF